MYITGQPKGLSLLVMKDFVFEISVQGLFSDYNRGGALVLYLGFGTVLVSFQVSVEEEEPGQIGEDSRKSTQPINWNWTDV